MLSRALLRRSLFKQPHISLYNINSLSIRYFAASAAQIKSMDVKQVGDVLADLSI